MATRVQSPTGATTGGSTSVNLTFGSSVTAGNHIIADAASFGAAGAPTVSSVADNKGNGNYTSAVEVTGSAGKVRLIQYYKNNIGTGGATFTVTATWSTTTGSSLTIHEYSGVSATAPTTNSNSGTGTAVTSGAANPTGAAMYHVGAADDGASTDTYTTNAPWSHIQIADSTNTNQRHDTQEQTSTSGSQNGSFTLSSSIPWCSTIAAYPNAASGITVGEMEASQEPTHFHSLLSLVSWAAQHEVFVSDQQDVFRPIVPVATLTGTRYEPHIEHPNLQSPLIAFDHGYPDADHGDLGAPPILNKGATTPVYDDHREHPAIQSFWFSEEAFEEEQWTNRIILPLVGWDNDADHQLAQPPTAGDLAEYDDRMLQIVLPPPAWDTDAEQQNQQLPYQGLPSDAGQDATQFVIIPVIRFDTDGDHQLGYLAYQGQGNNPDSDVLQLIIPAWNPSLGNTQDSDQEQQKSTDVVYAAVGSDSGQDWTQQIILPPGWNPALGNTQDNDAEQQLSTDVNYAAVGSDSGQDQTQYIILPLTGWDTDADSQKQWADWFSAIASDPGLDNTQFIILPLQNLDNDADQQRQWADWISSLASDSGQDQTHNIILPLLVLDNDADQQKQWPDWIANLASEAGQDWTQLIIVPPPPFDSSQLPLAEDVVPPLDQYRLVSDIEDSGWTCFVISGGGQVTKIIHHIRRGIG